MADAERSLGRALEEQASQPQHAEIAHATTLDLQEVLQRASMSAESTARAERKRFELAAELDEARSAAAIQAKQAEAEIERHREAFSEQVRRTASVSTQAVDLAKEV